MSDELTPITRKETFLAKVGGQNVVTPTPITREETFLQAIIDNGSGGGGGGGALVVSFNTEIAGALDKTWKEIHDVALSMPVIIVLDNGDTITQQSLYQVGYDGENYFVEFEGNGQFPIFSTADENGYPVVQV